VLGSKTKQEAYLSTEYKETMACIAYQSKDFFREKESLLLLSCLMHKELFGMFGVSTYNQ